MKRHNLHFIASILIYKVTKCKHIFCNKIKYIFIKIIGNFGRHLAFLKIPSLMPIDAGNSESNIVDEHFYILHSLLKLGPISIFQIHGCQPTTINNLIKD